ncbi:MAG: hypothetical protein ACJAU0_000047 [Flavobacteriales bacterium]|jgi:hypothetical protein
METGLIHLHSSLRWIVLILMIAAIAKAFGGRKKEISFDGTKKIALFAMISLHVQLLIGLALYFMRGWAGQWGTEGMMADKILRFFTMEHMLLMVIGIAIATIGYSGAKRMSDSMKQHKRVFITYLIALILILASIPWPFRNLGVDSWI